MSNPDLVKNIMRGAYRLLPYILEGVEVSKVRQICIKAYNSPSLPIYNYVSPEEVSYFQKYKKVIAEKAQAAAEEHK
jgi:L-asparaginase/Glu-tRNA(Gln) amidotransferase subunit D